MAALDAILQRLADGQQRQTEILKDFAERSGEDRREIREKIDELLRLQQEERTTLAELRHSIGDDVIGAFASALATHRAELALAADQSASALRHSVANSLQTRANEAHLAALHGEAAGGEKRDTDKLATVDEHGVRVTWATVGKALPYLLAAAGTASSWLAHYLMHR